MKSTMRKIVALMTILLLTLMLVACGGNNEKSTSENETTTESEQVNESSEEDTEEPAEEAKTTEFNQVVYEDNGVKFEITGADIDGFWGYTWKVYLENNTDKTLMYSMDSVSVNGMMCDPFWSSEVSPGKKENTEVSWGDSALSENGIEEVTQVEFKLRIYDSNDYMAEPIVEDVFIVYPKGESEAVTVERNSQEGDIVLFDTDTCSMTVTGFNPDDLFGYAVEVYIVNKTDKSLMFSVDSASINGFMADPFWASDVAAGKKSLSSISWADSTLEENGIDNVEEIELAVKVYDDDDYTGEYFVDDTFTINPAS